MSETPVGTVDSRTVHDTVTFERVEYAGESNEYVILGNKKYAKNDLMEAFGGTLNPGVSPYPVHQFANPAPLGLCAFAFTTFVLSLYNARAMGITVPNVVVSAACFYGGGIQFIAGVWELVVGNSFGGCALVSYGCFWLSYAVIFISSFGIADAYDDDTMFANACGIYLLAWALFTTMLASLTLKSTVTFMALFVCLALTFFLLAAGELTAKVGVTRAGGVTGVITAFLGWYCALSGTATKENSYFRAKSLALPGGSL